MCAVDPPLSFQLTDLHCLWAGYVLEDCQVEMPGDSGKILLALEHTSDGHVFHVTLKYRRVAGKQDQRLNRASVGCLCGSICVHGSRLYGPEDEFSGSQEPL